MSRNAEIERSFASDAETWHAIWVAPGQEVRVFRALHDLGFSPYLPRDRETVLRRGKKVDIERPLFPGYVFVRLAIWRDNSWEAIRPKDRLDAAPSAAVAGDVIIGQTINGSAIEIACTSGIDGIIELIKDGALPARVADGEVARPMYADIVAFLQQHAPFQSRRAQKRQIAQDRRIARLQAA